MVDSQKRWNQSLGGGYYKVTFVSLTPGFSLTPGYPPVRWSISPAYPPSATSQPAPPTPRRGKKDNRCPLKFVRTTLARGARHLITA